MGDPVYTTFSALCVLLNIAPLCWQLEHGNSGPVCVGFWVIIMNLNGFVNTLVWRNDAIDRAPVWCDISVKLYLAGPIGLLCGNICIARFLAMVVSPSTTLVTKRDRRNRAIFDYALCFGLPTIAMACQIVYQPNRYAVAKTMGCLMTLVITWPTYVLWMIWHPLLAFVGTLLSVYVLVRLVKHRRDFRKLLANSPSALTVSRFVRLGLLSSTYFCFTLPLSIFTFIDVQESAGGYIEYSWDFIHAEFNTITYYPFVEHSTLYDWVAIIAGLLVLVFFGFGGEAASYYAKLFRSVGGGPVLDGARRRWNKGISTFSPAKTSSPVTQVSLNTTQWSPAYEHKSRSSASLNDGEARLPELSTVQYSGPFGSSAAAPAWGAIQGVTVVQQKETV